MSLEEEERHPPMRPLRQAAPARLRGFLRVRRDDRHGVRAGPGAPPRFSERARAVLRPAPNRGSREPPPHRATGPPVHSREPSRQGNRNAAPLPQGRDEEPDANDEGSHGGGGALLHEGVRREGVLHVVDGQLLLGLCVRRGSLSRLPGLPLHRRRLRQSRARDVAPSRSSTSSSAGPRSSRRSSARRSTPRAGAFPRSAASSTPAGVRGSSSRSSRRASRSKSPSTGTCRRSPARWESTALTRARASSFRWERFARAPGSCASSRRRARPWCGPSRRARPSAGRSTWSHGPPGSPRHPARRPSPRLSLRSPHRPRIGRHDGRGL